VPGGPRYLQTADYQQTIEATRDISQTFCVATYLGRPDQTHLHTVDKFAGSLSDPQSGRGVGVLLERRAGTALDKGNFNVMAADAPTILATSGGLREGRRVRWEFSGLTEYAVDLAGVMGRAPRVCFVATAQGDNPAVVFNLYSAAQERGFTASHVSLMPMPNVDDIAAHLLGQDVVWVCGGSAAGLLALWKLHDVGEAMRAAWEAGVVLTGVSAGSLCWHIGGTTDSYDPALRPLTDGLGLVPFSNGVHYDSEPQRRPLFHRLIADNTLPAGYATDDGVGVVYRGTSLAEAVAENRSGGAYFVDRDGDGAAVEARLDVVRL
jgi:peptidase E